MAETVNKNADYKVASTKNASDENIQHVRLDIGTGSSDLLVSESQALPVSVSGVSTEATLLALSAKVASSDVAMRYDAGATYTYIGTASPGTLGDAAAWKIKRLTNSDNTIVWADGNANFDNVWNDRATLTYS